MNFEHYDDELFVLIEIVMEYDNNLFDEIMQYIGEIDYAKIIESQRQQDFDDIVLDDKQISQMILENEKTVTMLIFESICQVIHSIEVEYPKTDFREEMYDNGFFVSVVSDSDVNIKFTIMYCLDIVGN